MKKSLSLLAVFCFLVAGQLPVVQAATYNIDTAHSTIGFAATHLMISTTRGSFDNYVGAINFDPANPEEFSADVTIQVDSINTRNEKRDGHLKSSDFFDAANFPEITFKSSMLNGSGADAEIVGDLTIRGVTKSVTIPVSFMGPVQSPFGFSVISIQGETTINRQDFGVSWNKALDAGGYVVGDDVTLVVEIEASTQ